MQPRSSCCFTHPLGKDIYLHRLQNENGHAALITNYGGILMSYAIRMPDKSTNDIVLGFDNVHEYMQADYLQNYPYMGAAIGRYANRIRDGIFELEGKKYELTKNLQGNQLHGGLEGFDKKVWDLVSFDEENNIIELKYESADGEEGFPGKVTANLTFELTDDGDLLYSYSATSDQTTIINLTHHSYFNLNNGQGDIDDHELKIYADKILEQDKTLNATGNYIAVDNTKYDFREFRAIDAVENGGYDQSFDLNKEKDSLSMAAEVLSKISGLKLQIFTTDPVIHLYTAQGLSKMKGKKETEYGPYSGLCLETQKHPNAINIPSFPNTILKPGETYCQKTIYKICLPEK
jgi:aldose 1-epimerase